MKFFQKSVQQTTAKAVLSCFLLLLLYGCAHEQSEWTDDVMLRADAEQAELSLDAEREAATEQLSDGAHAEETQTDALLAVYVCGAVKRPGVYELPEGSRVYEALACAGGLTADASPTAVNQAQLLTDGEMIEILTAEQAQAQHAAEETAADGLLNINTASVEELKTLPGIGDAKARSIVAYREKNGAFASIEDIKKIEGIKDGVFAKLEGCIKAE